MLSPNQRLMGKHPWREMNTRQEICGLICLRTYLWRRAQRKGDSLGVPQQLSAHGGASHQINGESLGAASLPKTIADREAIVDLTWVTQVETKRRDKKKWNYRTKIVKAFVVTWQMEELQLNHQSRWACSDPAHLIKGPRSLFMPRPLHIPFRCTRAVIKVICWWS